MDAAYAVWITFVAAMVGIGIMADMVLDYTGCNYPPAPYDGSVES